MALMRWWTSRPVGLIYVGEKICSGDTVERARLIDRLPEVTKDGPPPKVVRFPVVTTGQERVRKEA